MIGGLRIVSSLARLSTLIEQPASSADNKNSDIFGTYIVAH